MTPLEEMGKYKTVVNPPWPLPGVGYKRYPSLGRNVLPHKPVPFETMTLTDIAQLPINDILHDDAFVFLWTVNKFLADAISLLPGMGLRLFLHYDMGEI